ncbi:SRPBCC family protein [Nocardia sp. alder85J]|uniref:SRPBCC family protein n=1 Tax=Nocardia sp. alder85J TaxID=2862949 RepID=UPI001CD615CC|nr:SRPBCC family protein [Nocardia sp. alder85J]MCX4091252.1 SRPBCC family protein [Nocardia sp. alder85J]
MTTHPYRPGPLQQVDLVEEGGRWSLVFIREFPQGPAAVWSALTEPDELREWAPYTADRSLATVGPVTLITTDGTRQELAGTVGVAEPPRLLEFTWGTDRLRWELDEQGTGTRLRLTHRLPDHAVAGMMAAGWHLCLDVAAALLDGTPVGPIVGATAMDHGWPELNEQYSRQLGVEPMQPPLDR